MLTGSSSCSLSVQLTEVKKSDSPNSAQVFWSADKAQRGLMSFPFFLLISAKLKTNKEVCVNPEIRWLQQYLKNAINK